MHKFIPFVLCFLLHASNSPRSLYPLEGLISYYDVSVYLINSRFVHFCYKQYPSCTRKPEPMCSIPLHSGPRSVDTPCVTFLFKNSDVLLSSYTVDYFLKLPTNGGIDLTHAAPNGIIRSSLVEAALNAANIHWIRIR